MGTHISRVKSVDLDSWTDEQLQSILSWGNARANKYWEAKLAAGHTPSEAKIENFIRTKYELKRWVMDGPMPDPASLDGDGDDDVTLSLVKEKQAIERKESIRKASVGQSQAPQADLIGADDPAPSRPSPAGPAAAKVPSKGEPAAPKTTSTKDSLLGLDFLGADAAPPRPSSTPGGLTSPGAPSRPDLQQSILSLYASAPKPQQHPPQAAQRQGSMGGMVSPTSGHHSQGSLGDAFGNLSISRNAPVPDPFAGLGGVSSSSRATSQPPSVSTFGGLSGGSFFDAKPAQPPAVSYQQKSSTSGFGVSSFFSTPFSSPPPTQPAVVPKPVQPSSSAVDDLFDLSSPITQSKSPPPPPPPTNAAPPASTTSVFNLSATQTKVGSSPPASTTSTAMAGAGAFGADVWGGNEWSAPDTKGTAQPAPKNPESFKAPASNMGWGGGGALANTPIVPGSGGGFNPAPKVTTDEEFGGWASSAGPPGGGGAAVPKPSGSLGGDDDLFSNVWQ